VSQSAFRFWGSGSRVNGTRCTDLHVPLRVETRLPHLFAKFFPASPLGIFRYISHSISISLCIILTSSRKTHAFPSRNSAAKAENLADHGLHPRATHILVNLPLLYGPVYIALIYRLFCFLPGLGTSITRLTSASSPSPRDLTVFCLASSCIFGATCLSAAPHQEPRFLLPLALPLCLLSHGPPGRGASRSNPKLHTRNPKHS